MVVEQIFPLDFWNVFVVYVFGGFWIAVIGLMLLMFVIMGVLGRISIYSVTWYCGFFLLCMTLGYGFIFLNLIITVILVIFFIFSWMSFFKDR